MIYDTNDQHSRSAETGETIELAKAMEAAAVACWRRGHQTSSFSTATIDEEATTTGVRVHPRRGHVTIFSGIKTDGYPNPLSFHGGEALAEGDGEKALLTFFYEVPPDSFTSRKEFGERVAEREQRFLERHFAH
jgi:hypothetical protein